MTKETAITKRFRLFHHVRDQRHETRPLDSERQITLLCSGQSETFRRINLPLRIKEAPKEVGILVIYSAELLS